MGWGLAVAGVAGLASLLGSRSQRRAVKREIKEQRRLAEERRLRKAQYADAVERLMGNHNRWFDQRRQARRSDIDDLESRYAKQFEPFFNEQNMIVNDPDKFNKEILPQRYKDTIHEQEAMKAINKAMRAESIQANIEGIGEGSGRDALRRQAAQKINQDALMNFRGDYGARQANAINRLQEKMASERARIDEPFEEDIYGQESRLSNAQQTLAQRLGIDVEDIQTRQGIGRDQLANELRYKQNKYQVFGDVFSKMAEAGLSDNKASNNDLLQTHLYSEMYKNNPEYAEHAEGGGVGSIYDFVRKKVGLKKEPTLLEQLINAGSEVKNLFSRGYNEQAR